MIINGLVSVIIPTYNMRHWIGGAIDSAMNQTYGNIETIVVDNGSTDSTGDYVKERYGEKIKYVYQRDKGISAARNRGLTLARGEYVQFLDADDIISPPKISQQTAFLRNNQDYAAVYGDTLVGYEDDIKPAHYPELKRFYISGDILKQQIHNPFLWTVAVLVRRAWIEKTGVFDEALRSSEDWDFWIRMALKGGRFAYLSNGPVGIYRRPVKPRAADPLAHPESRVLVLRKLENSLDKASRRRLDVRKAIGRALFCYGNTLADNGYPIRGILTMTRGIALDQRCVCARAARIGLSLLPIKAARREAIFQSLNRLKDKYHGLMSA